MDARERSAVPDQRELMARLGKLHEQASAARKLRRTGERDDDGQLPLVLRAPTENGIAGPDVARVALAFVRRSDLGRYAGRGFRKRERRRHLERQRDDVRIKWP